MPLFDFRCRDCGKAFELLVRRDSEPRCPLCGGGKVDKQISLPAPLGQSAGIISRARAQAAREGHFSQYAPSEKPRR